MEEHWLGSLLVGMSQTSRRFCAEPCTGCPTVFKMQHYWGDALQNLPAEARKIHQEKGFIYHGKKGRGRLTPEEAKYELGIVSYPGTGKYKEANIYIPFHELPDHEDVATQEQLQRHSPPGQGWWPVICLQTVVDTEGRKKVLLVCYYQIMTDGQVIAWWIYI